MFNPEMMRAAQEMMSKMTPEQMAALQQQMASMSPDQMQAAMNMARSATPDQVRQAQEAARHLTPEQVQQATSTLNAQQKYKYDASLALKAEGNRLHGQGRYAEAADKYSRAIANLEGLASPDAGTLRLACQNNLSNCRLQLGQHAECVQLCAAVLAADAANRKALYRRGQALAALGRAAEAAADLRAALELSPAEERPVVQTKLEEALAAQAAAELSGPVIEEVTEAAAGEPGTGVEVEVERPAEARRQPEQQQQPPQQQDGLVMDADEAEEVMLELEPPPKPAVQPSSSAAAVPGFGGGLPGRAVDPAAAAAMIKQNPDMLKTSAEMMASMSDEQIEAMLRAQGAPPGTTPAMVRMQAQMMRSMPPDALTAAMEAQAAAGGSSGGGATPSGGVPGGNAAPSGGAAPSSAGVMPPGAAAALEQVKQNPEMLSMAAQMMESMPPEQLQAMMGSMPGAPKMDAAQLKMAAQMMKNMRPEDLEAMNQMAQQMGGAMGGGPSAPLGAGPSAPVAGASDGAVEAAAAVAAPAAAGGASPALPGMPPGFDPSTMDMSRMRKMMEDPQMLKTMQGMLRSVDSETLARMMASSGMKVTPEQAKQMVDKLGGVSDKHLELLSKLMRYYNAAAEAYARFRAWLASNGALALALLIIVIAVLLKWLGWM